jgi:hypothetical protein
VILNFFRQKLEKKLGIDSGEKVVQKSDHIHTQHPNGNKNFQGHGKGGGACSRWRWRCRSERNRPHVGRLSSSLVGGQSQMQLTRLAHRSQLFVSEFLVWSSKKKIGSRDQPPIGQCRRIRKWRTIRSTRSPARDPSNCASGAAPKDRNRPTRRIRLTTTAAGVAAAASEMSTR